MIRDYALAYAKKGISVMPIDPKSKRPCLDTWLELQNRVATEEEINYWFERWPNANVGIITGKISGIFVVDIDTQEMSATAGLDLPPTPTVKTARGWHYYYKHPGKPIGNSADKNSHIDTRGDGGFVVAPPSVHATGHIYEWVLTDVPFAEVPKWVYEKNSGKKDWNLKIKGASQGDRNNTAAEIAGKLLGVHKESEWDFAWEQLVLWNQRNAPPLEEKELRATFESIARKEKTRREKDKGGFSVAEIEKNDGE